jgi:hypothetical protein
MTTGPKENNGEETRQEAREKKLRKKRAKMKQHGKGLAQMYKDAAEKRTLKKGEE